MITRHTHPVSLADMLGFAPFLIAAVAGAWLVAMTIAWAFGYFT